MSEQKITAKQATKRAIEKQGDTDCARAISAILDAVDKGLFSAPVEGHLSNCDQHRLQIMEYKVELKHTPLYKDPFTLISWFEL